MDDEPSAAVDMGTAALSGWLILDKLERRVQVVGEAILVVLVTLAELAPMVAAPVTIGAMVGDGDHQKEHYVHYYLDIVSNRLQIYVLGIFSMFSTLRR